MRREHVVGTSSKAVLLRLTRDPRAGTWNSRTGAVLYENKEMTRRVCERLALQGYLQAQHNTDDGTIVYTITSSGSSKAKELRRGW